jgi:hypothetical protein
MPEPPDFDQIAQRLAMSLPGAIGPPFVRLREQIAQELRLAWNARGAADIVRLEAELSTEDESTGTTRRPFSVKRLYRALRSLDR